MRVGFVGLGRMGQHMARNLVKAGHDVTLWNRSADKARALSAETGAAVAETPAALAEAAEVVVTMLADDPSSEAVHFGRQGLYAATGARVFVEMGTMSPAHITHLAKAAPAGSRVIDAPVSGATQAAEAAQLLIMAGSTDAEADPIRAVLDPMSKAVICLGATGSGAVMKLAVNSLLHAINQSFAEAMTLAEAAGIASERAFDVIEASAAAAPMLSYRRPLYLDEAAHDVSFTVALAKKDMAVTAAVAQAYGLPMPQAHVTLAKLEQADAAGYGARDMAAILEFIRGQTT